MPLSDKDKAEILADHETCASAISGKPMLGGIIYDAAWRADLLARHLAVDHRKMLEWPIAYAKHSRNRGPCPADFEERLEEGASILLPKLQSTDRNNLIQRMREDGCDSAVDELMLARGFARLFGDKAISGPVGFPDQPRPEFTLAINGLLLDIEAVGVFDSAVDQSRTKGAIDSGGGHPVGCRPEASDIDRFRSIICRKILRPTIGSARVLLVTKINAAWCPYDAAVHVAREIALNPQQFKIKRDKWPLCIGLVLNYLDIVGAWINHEVADRLNLSIDERESIRGALRDSFYPRDGVFFGEQQDNAEHRERLRTAFRYSC